MKICSKCLLDKNDSEFYKSKRAKSGLQSCCKTCQKALESKYQNRGHLYLTQYQTKSTLLKKRWHSISNRYRFKGYENIKVLISKEEFISEFDNTSLDLLFRKWDEAGRPHRLTPSIDRIDPDGHYTASNMRWVTVATNSGRARRKGVHRKRKVAQFTKGGVYVHTFESLTAASKVVGGLASNISLNAHGKIPSAYGYTWKYVDKS